MKCDIPTWDGCPVDRLAAVLLAAMLVCSGCSGRNVTADNPVVSLVPPRTAVAQENTGRAQVSQQDIAQVAFEPPDGQQPLDPEMTEVAAVVNGTPILVSDVLEPNAANLMQAKLQLPEDKYQKLQEALIKRDLPRFIDETVLMNAAVSQLDKDKRDQLETQLDDFFTQHLQVIQEKLDCGTLAELEAKMQAQGTTLSNLRRAFGRQQLAAQARQLYITQQPTASRQELLAEYEKRIDSYKHPAQVKWQQIWISYDKHGGKQNALAVMEQAINELRSGTDFASVARKYSDGVMASNGGNWDWTRKGSLADSEIEKVLYELNIGEIGQPIDGEKAFQILRVIERQPDRVTPFEEVQGDLRKEIVERKKAELEQDLIKRLKKDAVITTMFDAT